MVVGGFYFFGNIAMLNILDQLLLEKYLTVYQTLHKKLYHYNSRYTVISLNDDSVLTNDTVNELKCNMHYNGTLYVVLYNKEPVCYFTMLIKRTSLVSNELIVKQIHSGTMYDAKELVHAITSFCLILLYERKLYTVNKIWFYLNKPFNNQGKLYQHDVFPMYLASGIELEWLQQNVDKRYTTKSITTNDIRHIDNNTLCCIGDLIFNTTDVDYLRNFNKKLIGNNTLNLVYTTNKYPVAIVISTHDNTDTLYNCYGDTSCLNSYVANMLLNSEFEYRELCINDYYNKYANIEVVNDYMCVDKYISSVNIAKNEYKELGDTICNI